MSFAVALGAAGATAVFAAVLALETLALIGEVAGLAFAVVGVVKVGRAAVDAGHGEVVGCVVGRWGGEVGGGEKSVASWEIGGIGVA